MNQLTTSLWGDESFTAVAVQETFSRMLEIVAKDTAPPLYYIFLYIWTRIFGNSEIAIRSLSVLLYLGTIFFVYLIIKKISNKKTAFLGILLTLSNPFLFPFAFEGRMYAILVFFVTASFYFFIAGSTTGYVLTASASLYSHHYAALAIIFQFLWKTAVELKNSLSKNISLIRVFLKIIKPYFLIFLLYLPWIYPLYKQITMVSGGFWLGRPKLKDLPTLYRKYLVSGEYLFQWQKYLLVLPIIILIVKKWKKNLKKNLIFLGWALVPVLIAFIISQGKTSLFYDRYLIFIIPALCLLLATGIRKISIILILIYCLPFLYVNFDYFTHPTKRPFRPFSAYIKKEINDDDFLINYNGSAHHLWETKFYGIKAPIYNPGGDLPYYVGTAQMTEDDIVKQLPDKKRIGVISSESPERIEIENYLLDRCEKFKSLRFCWFLKDEKK